MTDQPKRPRGRPKSANPKGRSPIFAIRIPEPFYTRLRDLNPSVVRDALLRLVQHV